MYYVAGGVWHEIPLAQRAPIDPPDDAGDTMPPDVGGSDIGSSDGSGSPPGRRLIRRFEKESLP